MERRLTSIDMYLTGRGSTEWEGPRAAMAEGKVPIPFPESGWKVSQELKGQAVSLGIWRGAALGQELCSSHPTQSPVAALLREVPVSMWGAWEETRPVALASVEQAREAQL